MPRRIDNEETPIIGESEGIQRHLAHRDAPARFHRMKVETADGNVAHIESYGLAEVLDLVHGKTMNRGTSPQPKSTVAIQPQIALIGCLRAHRSARLTFPCTQSSPSFSPPFWSPPPRR